MKKRRHDVIWFRQIELQLTPTVLVTSRIRIVSTTLDSGRFHEYSAPKIPADGLGKIGATFGPSFSSRQQSLWLSGSISTTLDSGKFQVPESSMMDWRRSESLHAVCVMVGYRFQDTTIIFWTTVKILRVELVCSVTSLFLWRRFFILLWSSIHVWPFCVFEDCLIFAPVNVDSRCWSLWWWWSALRKLAAPWATCPPGERIDAEKYMSVNIIDSDREHAHPSVWRSWTRQ